MPRRRGIRRWLQATIAVVAAVTTSEAGATPPAPLGSQALYHWLASTAAQALKASEQDNDLRRGGLLAANRSVQSSLDQLETLSPEWLAQVDLRLALAEDLTVRYGVSATRELYQAPEDALMIDAFGRVDIDQAGRSSGEIGLGLEAPVQDDRFEIDVSGGIDQEWLRRRERYIATLRVDWWRLRLTGSAFNEVTMDEPTGAIYEERLLDGMDLNLETGVPYLPWLVATTQQRYLAPTAPNADAWRSARYGLKARPLAGLEIEAGRTLVHVAEPIWFASIRYTLTLGGR